MELEEAIKSGDLGRAEALILDEPILSSQPTSMGVSALLFALYYQQRPIADAIAASREIDLFEASALGNDEVISRLAIPSNVDAFSRDGFTALGYAAYFGNEEACKALIHAGANPNIKSNNGLGVLPHHSALSNDNPVIAKLVIEAGGDPNE